MRTKGRKPIPVKIVHDGPTVSEHRPKDSMSLSVRQIKNGYLVNRYGYKDGKHFDEEMYTPRCPQLDMPATKEPQRSQSRNQRLGRTKI
jgi:hypothetical protein